MASPDRRLDVFRMEIDATVNDQVLATPGYVKLTVPNEAEIASPQECFLTAGDLCVERRGRCRSIVPVSLGNVVTANPDLAFIAVRHRFTAFRLHDYDGPA